LPNPGSTFKLRKEKILSQLSVPDEQYTDASPKGSVDAGIRHLIAQINAHAGLVTTSSCAGRVSVYLEGRKSAEGGKGPAPDDGQREMPEGGESQSRRRIGGGGSANGNAGSSAGGKGGGEWLFVSHDPVPGGAHDAGYGWLLGSGPRQAGEETGQDAVDSAEAPRLIHFKFEPMILHVLTASLEHAQLVIQAGMEAGFRETGAVSLLRRQPDEEATPMVAVRSMGLSFESLIGAERNGSRRSLVTGEYLETLVKIANERFVENERRIARFSNALEVAFTPSKEKENWEDAQVRRVRKRQEGLMRRK
ncbi:hypothetical protein BT67DRAFT_340775, partial [Trichocladium antarcticum]